MSTMREGESAREYADRLQAERQAAWEVSSQAYETLKQEQIKHDLAIVQQMTALVHQLLAYTRNEPRADVPIHGMSTVTALTGEIVERLDHLKRSLGYSLTPNR